MMVGGAKYRIVKNSVENNIIKITLRNLLFAELVVDIVNTGSGTSLQRPTINLLPGKMFFDLTLDKPIFYTGLKWIDAMGNDV